MQYHKTRVTFIDGQNRVQPTPAVSNVEQQTPGKPGTLAFCSNERAKTTTQRLHRIPARFIVLIATDCLAGASWRAALTPLEV
jgi:hypothetical protein